MADENPNPNPNPNPEPGAANASTGSGDPWFANGELGLSQDTRDYLATKNYAGLEDAFKAKRTFETLARDRNAMIAPDPARLSDWDGWSRLGWEADATKFAAGVPVYEKFKGDAEYEGFHGDIVKGAHDLKIPLPLAKALADRIGGFMSSRNEALDAATARESAALDAQLRQKWGPEYDANVELAHRASKLFGLEGADLGELEAIMGTPKFVAAFHRLGMMLGEDKLVTPSAGAGGPTTPAAARAERQRLKADRDFLASLDDARHPEHRANKERWQKLIDIEAGG